MLDQGQRATERIYADVQRRLKRNYRQAVHEVQAKLDDFNAKFKDADKQNRKLLLEGKISKQDYDAWLRGQVFRGEQWRKKRDQLTETLYQADTISQRIVNGERIGVFTANRNYMAYAMETGEGVNFGFGVYDSSTVANLLKNQPNLLPPRTVKRKADVEWYHKIVNNCVTQGIIQGEGIPAIAKRIAQTTGERGYNAAVRNARTAMTSAQNAGRIEMLHEAQDMGIKVKKRWLATLDDRTRDAHADLDGQVQEVDDYFESSLGPILFPGDPTAAPGNVYNCFVGETNVATDADIIRSYKHDYSGELITVKTAGGVQFTCTPNHPILTPSGWVAAKCLNNGDDLLIASIGEVYALRVNPHVNHTPSRIDAIHQFFDITGSKRTVCLGVNFHGDVPASDVEIITQKRFLRNNRDSGFADCVDKFLLKHTNESLAGKSAFMQHFRGVWLATLRFVGGFSNALSFFGRHVIHAVVHGFRPIARRDAAVLQTQADNVAGDVQFLRKRLDGFTGKVFADNIVNIEITTVSHVPVYNLQTSNSRYFVNSIIAQNGEKCNGNFAIAHNCRCTLIYEHPEYPSEYARRDNIDGEIIEDMTYWEWESAKKNISKVASGGMATTPKKQTGLEALREIAQNTTDKYDFWTSLDEDQQAVFMASGVSLDDAFNMLHEGAQESEWKKANPGGPQSFAIYHDFTGANIEFNKVRAKSDGWMADANAAGIINVRADGLGDDWEFIISHEAGHQLADYSKEIQQMILYNPGDVLGRYNMRLMAFDGVYGEYNPEEAFATSVSNYVRHPKSMKEKYPETYDAIDSLFKASPSALDFVKRTMEKYVRDFR